MQEFLLLSCGLLCAACSCFLDCDTEQNCSSPVSYYFGHCYLKSRDGTQGKATSPTANEARVRIES